MNYKHYSSSIKKTPYKYPVAKRIAKLMLDGKEFDEIIYECVDNNYIEIESLERRKEITNTLYRRLCSLDAYLLNSFYFGDVSTSKYILVYSIAKTDSLFFSFLFEKYRDSLMDEDHRYLSMNDFDAFFASKKQEDVGIAKWGHFTLECLTKAYKNILVESGMGKREKKTIIPCRVMVHPDVEEHIRILGDNDFLRATLGGD